MANKQFSLFFTSFSAPDRKQRHRLPQTWSSYVGHRLPCVAFLRNRYGDIWGVTVTLDKKTNRYSFEDGWKTFVVYNKVEYKDHIVFQYDGESIFDYKLYNKSDQEKEYVRVPNYKNEQPQEVELEKEPDEECQGIPIEPVESEPEDSASVDDESPEEWTRTKKTTCGKRAPRINEANEEAVFRKGGIPRPDNPYFVTKRRSTRNDLYIQTEVLKDFSLQLPEKLVIHDEEGNVWNGETRTWRDGRVWLTKGWKAFCKHNHVGSDDWILIEIVRPKTSGADIFLKARRVPASALSS